MKTIASFVMSVLAVLVLAIPAEAQYRSRGSYGSYGQRRPLPGGWGGGGGYNGYYDPSYLQQMMSLPNGLAACTVDLSTAKVTSCHPVVKEIQVIEAHARDHADRGEMLGTVHIEKGRFHFRPFDDTNGRLGTMSAGALGAGAGAMVGYGATQNMRNRGKANAIGASATIGGGLLAGWLASHHTHNNCLTIEPTVARLISAEIQSPAPSQEQGNVQQPIAGPAANAGEGEFSVENKTHVYVEAYDGSTYLGRMAPGVTLSVGPPKDRYRGYALIPNKRGGLSKDEVNIEPSDSGWAFVEPDVARGRQ